MGTAKLEFKPTPRKKVFLAVAVTHEMKLDVAAKAKTLNMSVSELMRVLAQKFLNGDFDKIEDIKRSRSSRKQNKAVDKPRAIGGE